MTKKIDRTGEINTNTQGLIMKIIAYRKNNDIDVQFEDGTIKTCEYGQFKKGKVKNPNHKRIWGVAYIGDGKYKSCDNYKFLKSYRCWESMLRRCYDKKLKERQPTYKDVICCEEWLNYQNFAKWYDENYYKIEGEQMALDKDILIKGNKVYSPKTCCFVPKRINSLFVKNDAVRGSLPIGVRHGRTKKGYQTECNILNNPIYLGTFSTPEEAFKVYKEFKENYIKQVADEYKDKIPKKLYEAMYRYEVEITD